MHGSGFQANQAAPERPESGMAGSGLSKEALSLAFGHTGMLKNTHVRG
jgi:hypothetical protein